MPRDSQLLVLILLGHVVGHVARFFLLIGRLYKPPPNPLGKTLSLIFWSTALLA